MIEHVDDRHDPSDGLLAAATSILAGTDLESTVGAALAAACRLTGAAYAAVGIVDPATGQFGRYLTLGLDDATVRAIGEPPMGRGVLGLLLRERDAINVSRIGSHPESYGFPVNHPIMTSFLGIGLRIEDRVWGSFCVTDKADGAEFTAADEQVVRRLGDLVVHAADSHLRTEAAQRRARELERDRAAYAASIDLARSLAGEPDLDRILELVVKRGRVLTGARGALLALPIGGTMVVTAVAGTLADGVVGEPLPLGAEAVATIEAGAPVLPMRRNGLGRLADWLEAASVLVVPLLIRRQPVGLLVCVDHTAPEQQFGEREVALAEAFGISAAVAIVTARTAQEQALQRAIAASERERAHWARELHDQTLQELAAIKLLVNRAQRASDDAARAQLLAQAAGQIDGATIDLRRLVSELRPAMLDLDGLGSAIDVLASRVAALGGIDVVVNCALGPGPHAGAERLPAQIEGVVYRIAQEALHNVAHHSEAGRAEVTVECVEGRLTLRVSDDGNGFDPAQRGSGFGLIGMRERAELVGGDLRVESQPGGGTVVTLVLPVEQGKGALRGAG